MTTGLDQTKFTQLESRDAYKQFYDDQGFHYGNHHLTAEFPRARFIIERVSAGDTVLEMGCQTGGITRLIAPLVNDVIANELSDSYRTRANEVLQEFSNVRLVPGFAEDLWAYYRGTVNVVIAMELLEHVSDPAAICATAKECLVENGKALFSVPKGYTDALGEHVREFTEASYRQLLEEHFSQVVIEDAGEWLLAEATR